MPGMSLCPVCPAARSLAGPEVEGPSVICTVMANEDLEADGILEGMFSGVLVTSKNDPSTFYGFCHGNAIPMVSQTELDEPRGHYTFCPIWLDGWQARQEGKSRAYAIPDQPDYIGKRTGMTSTLTDEAAAQSMIEEWDEPS